MGQCATCSVSMPRWYQRPMATASAWWRRHRRSACLQAGEQNRLSLRERTGSGSEQKMYAHRRIRPAMSPPYARASGRAAAENGDVMVEGARWRWGCCAVRRRPRRPGGSDPAQGPPRVREPRQRPRADRTLIVLSDNHGSIDPTEAVSGSRPSTRTASAPRTDRTMIVLTGISCTPTTHTRSPYGRYAEPSVSRLLSASFAADATGSCGAENLTACARARRAVS